MSKQEIKEWAVYGLLKSSGWLATGICHSETLARSGQAKAISGKRFLCLPKGLFCPQTAKNFRCAGQRAGGNFLLQKRGTRAQKVGRSFTQLWHVREFPNYALPVANTKQKLSCGNNEG